MVIFGAFFVLNLMIAVQFSFLGDAFDSDERERQQVKEKIIQSKKSHIGYVSDDDSSDEEIFKTDSEIEESSLSPLSKLKRSERKRNNACCSCMKSDNCFDLSQKVEKFVEDDRFKSFIMVIIVLNTIALMTESYD